MSEKRFEYDPSINHFTDTETNKEYCEYNIDKICDLLNEYEENLQMCREKALYWRNKAENIFGDMKTNIELQRENQTLYCQLNNFKLCKWDLDEENKLLKQALCETLQDTGNGYLIKIMDKLFELEYNKWESKRYYEDWEETLELKELRDLYEK